MTLGFASSFFSVWPLSERRDMRVLTAERSETPAGARVDVTRLVEGAMLLAAGVLEVPPGADEVGGGPEGSEVRLGLSDIVKKGARERMEDIAVALGYGEYFELLVEGSFEGDGGGDVVVREGGNHTKQPC